MPNQSFCITIGHGLASSNCIELVKSLPGPDVVPMHLVLFEVPALKNPAAQGSHLICEDAEPALLVNLPGGHWVWRVHCSIGQPVGDICRMWSMRHRLISCGIIR